MDLVSSYEGICVVSRCWDAPGDYPVPNAQTAYVKVYWRVRNPGEAASAWNEGPTVAPNGSGAIPYNPASDRNVEIALMPYSASGNPAFASVEEAYSAALLHQRETEAPVIGQHSDATTEDATVGVSGYSPFARQRRVKIATALDGSGHLVAPTVTVFDSTPNAPPPWIDFTRGSGPQTIYVAVAHSSGDGTHWTPDSNILTLTFASAEGTGGGGGTGSGEPTGGTTGDFDPQPRHRIDL